MSRFVNANPNQPLLLPVGPREWVPEDDMVHFVLEAVERIPLKRFRVNERGTGSAHNLARFKWSAGNSSPTGS